MGMNLGSSQKSSGPGTLAEINVTPLVDVMLVLLVIFMISAPLMQQGIPIDLPKANANNMSETPDQLELSIDKDQKIQLGKEIVSINQLKPKLSAMVAAKPQIQIYIRADQTIPYGFVAQVMAEVKQAQVSRVGLVTEPMQKK